VNPDDARNRLEAELSDIDAQAERANEPTADAVNIEGAVGQHPGDYGSEVAAAMDQELLSDTLAEQRRRITAALERLDEGTYGQCMVCGKAIDDERLDARPEALTCREHADTPVVV
jgi:RNA polymerase-binding transcription factor DksA